MPAPILATKLYLPPPRPKAVLRPRLIERLNAGLGLTLISAPAGFGKTTLVSEWVAGGPRPTAWLSLDEGDNDPARFLTYFVAALQMIKANIGAGVVGLLQAPQPPPTEALLTTLLNEIAAIPDNFSLVLDDYHAIEAKPVDHALTFVLEHLPPQMRLVIATREDPDLPLARLRARGQLTELRAADLRFTPAEAAEFLQQVMGLHLSAENIAALETRTEGWIAGLQLAALSMQGHHDTARFIQSFTGSHRFVMDYLAEEVLQQQPESVQAFLLRTSILNRLCGPLCEAVVPQSASGQASLEHLERANLFIVPLDNERKWYRYHHLFAELLQQRLQHSAVDVSELHRRASAWYENNGLELEAFQHAIAAQDVEHAAQLVEGHGMPLHFRGGVFPVLNWLSTLPATVLEAHPALLVMYSSALLFVGQLANIEPKLQIAEALLQRTEPDAHARDLIGHIASIRATLAAVQHDAEAILTQSHRALEYLHPNNLPVRTATIWTLAEAHLLQKNRRAARKAFTEALAISQSIGHYIITLLATLGLGNVQLAENELPQAAETYQHVLRLAGDPPLAVACEPHFGLAQIFYEWNDLEAAQQHVEQSQQLARQIENTDRATACELFLARIKLAQGDVASAPTLVARAAQTVETHHYAQLAPEVAALQTLVLLQQGEVSAAAQRAEGHDLPFSQARVYLAQSHPAKALSVLEAARRRAEQNAWADEQLQARILEAVAFQRQGNKDAALKKLREALALAEPGNFIRSFVDEGEPMQALLTKIKVEGGLKKYVEKLLAAFGAPTGPQPLIEPLSERELEVLRLIAQGFSNEEIGARLFLALSTVKGHNRVIFDKLHVQRRTEAVARARELGLI